MCAFLERKWKLFPTFPLLCGLCRIFWPASRVRVYSCSVTTLQQRIMKRTVISHWQLQLIFCPPRAPTACGVRPPSISGLLCEVHVSQKPCTLLHTWKACCCVNISVQVCRHIHHFHGRCRLFFTSCCSLIMEDHVQKTLHANALMWALGVHASVLDAPTPSFAEEHMKQPYR